MKKWSLLCTDAAHHSKLKQAVGGLGSPAKEQIRQIAMPQQDKKLQQLATGRCARIREKEASDADDASGLMRRLSFELPERHRTYSFRFVRETEKYSFRFVLTHSPVNDIMKLPALNHTNKNSGKPGESCYAT